MPLILGTLLALGLIIWGSEEDWLGLDNERAWINHLADESRRGRKARKRGAYSKTGWRAG